jgi:hypothetical protein
MSIIGSIEMLLESGWADTSTGRTPTGPVVSDRSLHAELSRATSGIAATLAAREVLADTRRIENPP